MRNPISLVGFALLLGLNTPVSSAQEVATPRDPDIEAAATAWRAEHGPTWRTVLDEETGRARFVYGGNAAPAFTPRTDADFFDLSRQFATEAVPMMGIDPATLLEDSVILLPLSLAGSSDKITVQFHQAIDGIPVRRGFFNALFLTDGRLISLDTTGLPGMTDFSTRPDVSPERARAIAAAAFRADLGLDATELGDAALEILQERVGKVRFATLVWSVDAFHRQENARPEGRTYFVRAQGAPTVVSFEERVHDFDVGGTVSTMATPGTLPDQSSNAAVQMPANYVTVSSSAGTTTTDAQGFFNFPGASGPLTVTVQYRGTYARADNQSGSDYSLNQSLSTGTNNSILMNPSSSALVTAEANCLVDIGLLRDWTRAINPNDSTADFNARANVNINSTCNAYYDGSSVNFYKSGGGCVNTAYSTVITHEMGHWLNDRYGSGNGSDGFGEGNSDVFGMYQWDDPITGENFFGNGFIRTGENTRQFCGDSNPGCYGQVHNDGEVLMGALWKVRTRLNASLGNTQGDLTADTLFNSWMNAYNDGQIKTIIETHWLTLDDNDGVIENGTPNYADIDGGFKDQGFPGYALSFVTFSNLVLPQTTPDENGPYGVAADIVTTFASSVTSANLVYAVDGGASVQVPMSRVTGDTYVALIPGLPSPASVEYHIAGTDNLGNSDTYPDDAVASGGLTFQIGEQSLYFSDDFETLDDNGWTHAQIQTQDDWQHSTPNGASGSSQGVSWSDPSSAVSGSKIWGNDLAPSGFNGSYQPNVLNYLRSPSLDLSSAIGSTLQFKRWLTVEQAQYDQASILVNGTTVWTNPTSTNLLDTSWTDFSLDISSLADGNPSVQLEWQLQSDGGLELGGWNLDDVTILNFAPTPTACQPVSYGNGTAGSNGVPGLDSSGQETRSGNANFVVTVKNGLASSTAYLGMGFSAISVPALGGTLNVLPRFIFTQSLDLFGQASFAAPVPGDPNLVGLSIYFQGVIADPSGPQGFSITPGLQATVCQ